MRWRRVRSSPKKKGWHVRMPTTREGGVAAEAMDGAWRAAFGMGTARTTGHSESLWMLGLGKIRVQRERMLVQKEEGCGGKQEGRRKKIWWELGRRFRRVRIS
jgi:hypothetical protein